MILTVFLQMIAVICPVYNEMRFIEAWLANVRQFADLIIVCDTGSTDGTAQYLVRKNDVKFTRWYKDLSGKWYVDFNDFNVRTSLLHIANDNGADRLGSGRQHGRQDCTLLQSARRHATQICPCW